MRTNKNIQEKISPVTIKNKLTGTDFRNNKQRELSGKGFEIITQLPRSEKLKEYTTSMNRAHENSAQRTRTGVMQCHSCQNFGHNQAKCRQ